MIRYHIYAVCALHVGRRNVIDEWLNDLGNLRAAVSAELRVLLSYLRDLPRDEWEMPMYRQTLQGYPKIGEVRFKCSGTQFRVFGFFGPFASTYTLLGGATEKMRRYNPTNAIDSADKRREKVLNRERLVEKFHIAVADQAK